jgi:long-chain acyl-CoA synthetase
MTEQQRVDDLCQTLSLGGTLIHVNKLLERSALLWPTQTAVICDNEPITYQELFSRATLFSHHLGSLGVKEKDRVILFYENSIEFFVAYFGIWQTGAVVAPLNVFLSDAEFAHIVHDAEPKAVVISPAQKVKLTSLETLETLPIIIEKDALDRTKECSSPTDPVSIPVLPIDDMVALLYTSGTTGFPKAVMLSSRNIIVNAIQGIARINAKPEDRVYCGLPLFHSLPQNICVWANTILGSTAIIGAKIDRRSLLNGLQQKPPIVFGVPALYGIFCLMKTLPFESVEYFFSGGDALSDKMRALFGLIYRRTICNGYGLTETSPFISVDIDDYTQPTHTVGKPFIGVLCAIRDDIGNDLPQGSIGTLWVKGDNIMLGYYKAPEATASVLKNGWFSTGDLAYINKNGKIVLAGRQKDLIIQKGIKIYPQEVENVLLSHPKVLQAAVIGITHGEGETIVAFIASRETNIDELTDELRALCKRTLAPYKVPHEFIIKHELPITPTGKIDKKLLKAEWASLKQAH